MKGEKKLEVRNFIWLAVSLLILLALIGISFFKQSRSTRSLTRTWEIKKLVSDVVGIAKDAETGQRGYAITTDTDYLAPYHWAIKTYDVKIRDLKALIREDSIQQRNIFKVDSLIKLKFDQLGRSIDLTEQGKDSLLISKASTKLGKKYMDDVRDITYHIFEKEDDYLEERIRDYKNWRAASIVLALLAALIVSYCLLKIYRDVYPLFTEVNETRKKLQNTSANLAETVNKLKIAQEEKNEKLKEKDTIIKTQNSKIELLEKKLTKLKPD